MASITKILGTDGIKKSRVTLNDNFAAINQQVTEIAELLDGFEGSGSGFNGGLIAASIIPDQDEIHDLGTANLRFRDLYLSNNTIYLGENSISMANGNMLVNGNQLITNSRLLEEVAERARLLGIETTSRNQAISSVTSQLTSLANENEAIAETLTNLNTSFDNEILTAVGAETLARTTAISGINQTLTSLSNANAATAQSVTDLGTAFTADIAAAVGAETSARTTAISGINQTLTSISNANQAIAQSVTDLGSSFTSDIEDAVGAETSARTAAISDINQTLTSLSNANSATAQSVTNLSTSFTSEITGAISTETLARQNALAAEVLARAAAIQNAVDLIPDPTGFATTEDLEAEAASRVSAIAAEAAERARLLGIETTARTTAISGINQTLTTLNDANSATAQSVTNLSASFASDLTDLETDQNLLRTNAIAGVESSISALTTANQAVALSVTNLGTRFETDIDAAITGEAAIRALAITNIGEQISSLSNSDGANATRLNTLEAQYSITDGSILGFSQTSALKTVIDSAIATANQATVSSTTNLIAALGEQTSGVTQSMSADINALTNKVNAQYTLEVNADGNVAGMRLGADETGSSIAFTADSFKVSTGGPGGQLLTPFSIVNGQVAFNGAVSFSSGATGPAGPAGTNGTNGTNGRDGRDGVDGTNGLNGSDGLPGAPGADGVSTYFHVAYADTASGGGFSQLPAGKLYIGTYVDTTADDASSASNLWKWQLVKGEDGLNGENGIPGTNGADGLTSYLHIAYATNATGTAGFHLSESLDKTYLGTYTDFTEADSTNPALYTWTLIKGADGADGLNGSDGLPGAPGADGVSTYFHVAYADNASGGGFSQSAAGKLYIGTYVDTTAADAASGSNLWKWQLVKGADGTNGENGLAGVNGADGLTSYLHIAYANNSTGTVAFHLSDPTGREYLGTYTDFTEADSTNPALYTWTLVKGADGRDGVDGADGVDGSAGANARAVNLTCTSQIFTYNASGTTPSPANTVITAAALNTSGTVYYQFFKNDVSVQNGTSTTYTYTPQSSFTSMPDKIEVQIREGSLTGTVLARDQITMAGIKPGVNGSNGANGRDGANGADGYNGVDGINGTDGMTVIISNEAHTLPTTNTGTVTYTGSGTTIRVFEGATELSYDGGPGDAYWEVSGVGSSITVGSIARLNGVATVGNHSGMIADTASIEYTISGYRTTGAAFTFTKTQSFAKSIQGSNGADGVDGADGADGSAGANARAVNLTCTSQIFTYNTSGTTPSPSNTVITATALNTSGTVYYQFFKNDVSVQNTISNAYTYTPQSSFTSMPDKIEVQIREGAATGTVKARDQITMAGIKPGANGSNGSNGTNGVNGEPGADGTDGMTIILSNEAHTLPTTNTGTVTYTGSGTTIRVFEGATELNYTISGDSEGTYAVSGAGSSITVGSITDSGTFATVNNHSNMTANTASITYTIAGYRANGAYFTFTKTQSFAKSVQGAVGPQGPAPDTSQYLTTTTTIDGGKITTGIIKNGNFPANHTTAWNTYSTAGMAINLDQGAINAKNFYIAPDGTAAFKGDIDVTSGATVGGSPMNDFFEVAPEVVEGVTRNILKMKSDAYIGTTRFGTFKTDYESTKSNLIQYQQDFNLIADDYVNYRGGTDPRDGGGELQPYATTLAHMYVKRNDVVLEIGDLVKLDENNELVKASSAKDKTIVGILWQEVDFSIKESPLDKFIIGGKDTSEKDYQYRDSFGNKIPLADRDQKSIWKVASLGDSFDASAGLQGMKVCNQNGPVVKGDLLCSSDVPGYAMKQPVEYVITGFNNDTPVYEERQTINSFTLGKCMETCTFDGEGKATGIYGYLYCG
jgi:hypothetical protein